MKMMLPNKLAYAAVATFLCAVSTAGPVALAAEQSARQSVEQTGSANERLRALYEAEWAWRLEEFASVTLGDGRTEAGASLPKVDPASQERRIEYWQNVLAELDKIPIAELSVEERVNAIVFRTSLEAFVADGRFRSWEMPFNSDSSFWADLTPRAGLENAARYRDYLGRMRDIPRYFDEQIENMRAGLARGFSVSRATLAGRDASIEAFTSPDASDNPFYRTFTMMPGSIPAAQQPELQALAREVIERSVAPAYAKLLRFFREEYVPNARTTLAAEALPDGEAFYEAEIRKYTTLDLSAEEIHQVGLKEVARIDEEMREVMVESGFKGSFEEFQHFLKTDPGFYAQTPDELMGFSSYVAKRVDGKLGETIGLLPRHRFAILPVPDAIAPFYTAGRGGLDSCLMNTYDLPSRPLYNITALTLHECAPGHALQAALALEQPEQPAFRKETYFSGFGEGWGLYSEWLGVGMGVYRTPYEHFGRLSYEMWRACRLVIDTGIHHYGWTRQQAIDYLAGHTALSAREVETEVDRYISWPGQALAYKLGEMTIRRLRRQAEDELGARFDQRSFHDAILSLGSVPLPALEKAVGRYIESEQQRPAKASAAELHGRALL